MAIRVVRTSWVVGRGVKRHGHGYLLGLLLLDEPSTADL